MSFTTRGVGRSILLCRALRVQMRVFLYGRGEGGWSLLDTSDSVNSAGARTLLRITRLTRLRAWFGVVARPFGEDITPGVAAVN